MRSNCLEPETIIECGTAIGGQETLVKAMYWGGGEELRQEDMRGGLDISERALRRMDGEAVFTQCISNVPVILPEPSSVPFKSVVTPFWFVTSS